MTPRITLVKSYRGRKGDWHLCAHCEEKSPIIIDPRPDSIVEEFQDAFSSISYDPIK